MGEAKRRKRAGTYPLPDSLRHPLMGSREALMAGMVEGPDGEPRLSSLALANALGVPHSKIVRVIEKNRAELEKLGPILTRGDGL